ncbi:hypothetical protein BDV41DRAFT_537549 [Aspergillus transmontanensis]|uniref:DUF6604 domain-containing protein n=1 Tax=Aspergillus transmontanensis TaxID=1034304 RepID=A0A5N6W137_9EURO|nr:hypothetical protein BDV41DRAFT_537549 [Aspergillus transmontanensis]
MLPNFLQSSYARYKNDTNSFATWLLDAASKCGYRSGGLTSIAPPANKGKGKGKSKSKAKAANTSSNPVQYSTTIKELQVLADVVAKSALTVPAPVLTIAKRAIKLRKHVTSWFLGQGDTESNKRHRVLFIYLPEI